MGKGGWDLAIEITGKIVLHVISDKTDTDVELVVIVQTEQGHNRIRLRKHMTSKSDAIIHMLSNVTGLLTVIKADKRRIWGNI